MDLLVALRCATQYSIPVYWLHLPIGKTVRVPVYYGSNRGFPNGYGLEGRHSIDSTTAGHYDLVISNLKLSDAGSYTCIDKAGQGKSSSAQLSVIGELNYCIMVTMYLFVYFYSHYSNKSRLFTSIQFVIEFLCYVYSLYSPHTFFFTVSHNCSTQTKIFRACFLFERMISCYTNIITLNGEGEEGQWG